MKHLTITPLFRLLAGAVLVMSLAATAMPAQAAKIGGRGVLSLLNATPEETFKVFAGQTVIMQRPKDSKGYRRDRTIDVEGRFIAYFAPNGTLLVWSKDSDKVIQAGWGTGGSQNLSTGPDKKTGPLLCLNFTGKSARIPCIVLRYMNDNLFDSAAGNIFNLRPGAAVPAQLPRSPGKLNRVKAAIGQDK
jgi:hypothetical protein